MKYVLLFTFIALAAIGLYANTEVKDCHCADRETYSFGKQLFSRKVPGFTSPSYPYGSYIIGLDGCVYFEQHVQDTIYSICIRGADPKTIRQLSERYAVDGSHAYYNGKVIERSLVDVKNFSVLRDDNHVSYAIDSNFVYNEAHVLRGKLTAGVFKSLDQATLQLKADGIVADKNHFYMNGNEIIDANQNDLVRLPVPYGMPNAYYGDRQNVYFKDKAGVLFKLDLADRKTFSVWKNYGIATDSKHVYFYGKPLANIIPQRFTYLGWNYYKTNLGIFYCSDSSIAFDPISDDAAHFQLFDRMNIEGTEPDGRHCTYACDGSAFAKDALHVYLKGLVVPSADAITFQHLGGNYAADSKHVFWQDRILEGAKPEGFRVVDCVEALDGQGRHFIRGLIKK